MHNKINVTPRKPLAKTYTKTMYESEVFILREVMSKLPSGTEAGPEASDQQATGGVNAAQQSLYVDLTSLFFDVMEYNLSRFKFDYVSI